MKVVAFNGSPRPEGNTSLLIKRVFEGLQKEGIETELVQVGNRNVRGCIACYKCFETKNNECAIKKDIANDCLKKMIEADGIILGSPTYFSDLTPDIKAIIDRCGFVSRANSDLLKRKVGAAVVAVRRAGAIHTFDSLNHFFTISQMMIVGSNYWNIGMGKQSGDVLQDAEGLSIMDTLATNMAWLLKKIKE